ncbi:MAG: FMN-binding negative transcriptional regulator [Paracoccus sp. (in: a-proteobacteria)]|uniref:FMN-binding negative transcriptional regulator n=1 Tax=Paracoccus sp. TaxID=267 RepID=UPI0039E43653
MYVPPHFQQLDPARIEGIVGAAPLACIVAQTGQGLVANHLPLLSAPGARLIGHAALANDMHRLIAEGQEVLAIFRGEDGYVSPNFYPSKAVHHSHVPTWNYEVVHMHGRIFFQHDDHAKRAAVGLLTRSHERRLNGAAAWRMADAPADYLQGMLGNIVALRIEVSRVLAKSKLSQNRTPEDLEGAIQGMRRSGQQEIAARMQSAREG